ncbi:MAG: DUF5020 family protein [Bacteroidales bacterium]|nr:DUF5020 family protein [Bacteroidales bacterium]
MLKKTILAVAVATLAFATVAKAQTNLQMFYDLGRGYATTTLEGFYADNWGDTFFFFDHYYATKADRENGAGTAFNGSYFEIERNLNFWKNSPLADLSLHVEYDGATWGAGVACIGVNYFMHSADFKNIYNVALMYDHHIGYGSASLPLKLTGVWGMQDIFGVEGLRFSGFIDIWGLDSEFVNPDDILHPYETKFSILSEPQLWYNVGRHFGVENLHIGGEVELSVNFAGHYGFMCNPCIGTKWIF